MASYTLSRWARAIRSTGPRNPIRLVLRLDRQQCKQLQQLHAPLRFDALATLRHQQQVRGFGMPQREAPRARCTTRLSRKASLSGVASSAKHHAAVTEASSTKPLTISARRRETPASHHPGSARPRFPSSCGSPPWSAPGRADWAGTSCATGLPCRVMMKLSPWATRSSNEERWVFASNAPTVSIPTSLQPVGRHIRLLAVPANR